MLVGLSRSGRLDSCMAYLRGDCGCSPRKSTGGVVEVFLIGFSPRWVFLLGFPSAGNLWVTVNALLPIQPNVTSDWMPYWEKLGTE